MTRRSLFRSFVVATVLLLASCVLGSSFRVLAQEGTKVFTTEELSQFDGKNGHPAYYAYEGKVYDVTNSTLWRDGEHYGLHAGTDLTGKMEGAPHGTEVFAGFSVVGTYGKTSVTATPEPKTNMPLVNGTAPVQKAWYEQRLRPLGISILGWTGILLGVAFVLNFATCFALPWSSLPLPWKGARPGPDPLDVAPTHMRITTIHKYFAWATVIIGIVHGVIGFMQMLGYTI